MSTNNNYQEKPLDVMGMFTAVLSGILTFVGVIELSQELKILLIGMIAIVWLAFALTLWFAKSIVIKTYSLIFKKPNRESAEFKKIVSRVHLTALCVIAAIGLAYLIKALENRITPKPSYAENIYYMIVLDASENMNLPFEGKGSRWEAAQAAVDRFIRHANKNSNYGIVSIGGQNPNEIKSSPCDVPSVPLTSLFSKNKSVRPQKELSLNKLQFEVQRQRPEGGGWLSGALSLAKNELLDLPSNLDPKRIIVLIASASDSCTSEIDWKSLKEQIELTTEEIAVHELFLILMDESPGPKVTEFAEQVNQMPVINNESHTYVQVVNNYYLLMSSIDYVINRLEDYAVTPFPGNTPADIDLSPVPCCIPPTHENETATRIRETDVSTLHIVTVTPTSCSVTTPELTPVVSLSGSFCTATPTLTSTLTIVPTTMIYPTAKPTRDRPDNPPPPPPTDACCRHCGSDSQPCGDSCIALGLTCHVGPGCACP